MKIVLTGATGLIGRHLLTRLAPANEVVALTRRESPPEKLEGVSWVRQDLSAGLDEGELPGEVDGVIHLAQSERYRDLPDGAEDIFEVNVHSTFRLLEYARRAGASRFVLASTGGLYEIGAEPVSEDAPIAPAAPYFRSKRMAELLVEDYTDAFATTVLRFFFVYGPGQGRTLIPRFAASILAGEEIVIEGDPGMRINPIYADDAAAATEAALRLDGHSVINVAGEGAVSITELAETLAGALGAEPRLRHRGSGPGGDLIADTGAMRDRLGVTASTPLDQGLAAVARSQAVTERG
jgi:UDP-glucose 4-epimerase